MCYLIGKTPSAKSDKVFAYKNFAVSSLGEVGR